MNKFFGMSVEELEYERDRIVKCIGFTEESVAFVASPIGNKLLKQWEHDLVAIQRKYYAIKGTRDERLTELAKIQGYERRIRETIDLYAQSTGNEKSFQNDLLAIDLAIKAIKSKPVGR